MIARRRLSVVVRFPFGYPETVTEERRRKERAVGERTILIVEDDADINALLAKIVAREGFGCVQAYSCLLYTSRCV